MTKCSFCMSQNSQQGALNWLAGQVLGLLKKMENLENGQSKVPIALDALVASSPATVQGGRTKVCGRVASVFPEYMAPAPVASCVTPASVVDRISPDFTVHAVPDPVVEPALVEYVSSAPAVYVASAHVVEHVAPAPTPVTVAKHITPAPAVYAAPVPVEEYIAPAPAASFAVPAPTTVPVAEHISPAPAGYATRVPVVEYIATAPAPVTVVEHISSSAPAGYAAPAPLVLSSSLQRQWQALPRQCPQCVLLFLSWNGSCSVCR